LSVAIKRPASVIVASGTVASLPLSLAISRVVAVLLAIERFVEPLGLS
jgi:hypothetical protein